MSEKSTVYLIRHGEADNSLDDLINGQAKNAQLTDSGIAQSYRLGDAFKRAGLIPDIVYTSSAERAKGTGQHTLSGMGLELELHSDDRLLEQNTGDWTGRVASEVFTEQQVSEIEKMGKDFRPPNGESMNDIGARMFSWLADTEQKDEKTIFAFTHGGAIRGLASYLEDWTHERTYNTRPDYTSISAFRMKNDLWVPDGLDLSPDELGVLSTDPTELSYKLAMNETINKHLESVVWFGSKRNEQDVHARSDFDIQVILDSPSTELTVELNNELKEYPEIDLSIMYMQDILDEQGKVIFHDGTKGLFFMRILAEGKILHGKNVYSDLVEELDLEEVRPSLAATAREYLSRLRVMAALSPDDTQEFKKYTLKLFKDVLLFEGAVELQDMTILDNDTAVQKVSSTFTVSENAIEALDKLRDYNHTYSETQAATVLNECEKLVKGISHAR